VIVVGRWEDGSRHWLCTWRHFPVIGWFQPTLAGNLASRKRDDWGKNYVALQQEASHIPDGLHNLAHLIAPTRLSISLNWRFPC
jgi:hypothetical protein